MASVQTLGAHQFDLPFVLFYKLDEHVQKATLIDLTGIRTRANLQPRRIGLR